MRYARNLARGLGLVWNPGERIEGYTNFLWTLWMGVVHLFPVPDAVASLPLLLTNLAIGLLTVPLLVRLVRRLGGGKLAVVPAAPHAEPKAVDRVFVTITASNGALAPVERLRTIYPRYTEREPEPSSAGLVLLSFRDGTPYQGEDLIYEAADPERFFVRCTYGAPGDIPGTCLAERRMRSADLIVRFPRDWLSDWPAIVAGIDRLIASLNPH